MASKTVTRSIDELLYMTRKLGVTAKLFSLARMKNGEARLFLNGVKAFLLFSDAINFPSQTDYSATMSSRDLNISLTSWSLLSVNNFKIFAFINGSFAFSPG